jgi:threonine 3-dehydrogenase
MNILITGGAGLLGAALAELLVETQNCHITVFDIAADPVRLEDIADKITYICGDVGNFSQVIEVVKNTRPYRIFHLGALLGFACEENPADAMRINAMGTFHIFEAARLFDVPQILFASSVTTFAEGLQEPLMRDDSPQQPVNFYGVLKLLGEGMGRYYDHRHGVDFRSLRFPSVVGPGNRVPGLATYTTDMIEAAINGHEFTIGATPQTVISLIHVKDCARALQQLAEAPREKLSRQNYLVDGSIPVPMAAELVEMVKARFPVADLRIEPNPAWQKFLELYAIPIDDQPARDDWGWKAQFDYPAIIEDFIRSHNHRIDGK